MIKDSTTLHVLTMLNTRFEPGDAIKEMVALQKEFQVFAPGRSLRQAFALLYIVPSDANERERWLKFLDYMKKYPSDMDGVNGHDRVVKAFQDNLESRRPKPVFFECHAAKDDPRVTVRTGNPVIFSQTEYVVISIPTTPGREARQQAAETARARRASGARSGGAAKPASGARRGTRKESAKGKG